MKSKYASYLYSPWKAVMRFKRSPCGVLLGAEHTVGFSVRHDDLLHHAGVLGSISGMEGFDRHRRSRLEFRCLESVADHAARRPRFERPPADLTGVGILHIHEKPGMRICQPDLNDCSLHGYRFGRVIG